MTTYLGISNQIYITKCELTFSNFLNIKEDNFYETSDNTITATITDNNNTEVVEFEYSIENSILEIVQINDVCVDSQNPVQCLNSHDYYFQVDIGSITNVMMETALYFRRLGNL